MTDSGRCGACGGTGRPSTATAPEQKRTLSLATQDVPEDNATGCPYCLGRGYVDVNALTYTGRGFICGSHRPFRLIWGIREGDV